MFNRDFLKTLRILYVEDEEIARKQLEKVLNRLFKEVVIAKNGLEGFQTYQENRIHETPFDLILSDINMPQMSGIEMLEKIRTNDTDTPVIFTTARSETEYLLKAISLNTVYYALKPIDIEDIIKKIEEVCEKRYYQNVIHEKTAELQEYLKIINNVATINKMDKDGNITFANNLFLKSTGYNKEEILDKNFTDIVSADVDKNMITRIWDTLLENKTWKADLKCADKENNIFYIKSTIFKVASSDKDEYINIGFDSTSDVNQKREFQKKILNNIKDKNIQVAESQNNAKQYEALVTKLDDELKTIKQKHADLTSQIHYYEGEILNADSRVISSLKVKNVEIVELKELISSMKQEKENSNNNINRLSDELMNAKIEIENLYDKIKIKEKRIEDLLSLVDIRESQLKKYDPSFENL